MRFGILLLIAIQLFGCNSQRIESESKCLNFLVEIEAVRSNLKGDTIFRYSNGEFDLMVDITNYEYLETDIDDKLSNALVFYSDYCFGENIEISHQRSKGISRVSVVNKEGCAEVVLYSETPASRVVFSRTTNNHAVLSLADLELEKIHKYLFVVGP